MTSLTGFERLVTFGGRFHYAWVVAVASSVVALIGVEPLSLFGIFLEPISKDLGVSRGSVSAAYWIVWFCLGIASIGAGWATDRIGTRKILVFSTLERSFPSFYWHRQDNSGSFTFGMVLFKG